MGDRIRDAPTMTTPANTIFQVDEYMINPGCFGTCADLYATTRTPLYDRDHICRAGAPLGHAFMLFITVLSLALTYLGSSVSRDQHQYFPASAA